MRCGCAAALRPPIHKAAVPISESSTSSVDSDMAGTGCVSQKACVTCSCAQRQSRWWCEGYWLHSVRQTSSVAGVWLPRMSSELRASRSTALLSGIASSSSLPLGMLRDATRDAEARETEESGLKLRPCATASDSGGDSGPGKVYRSSRGKLRGLEEAER